MRRPLPCLLLCLLAAGAEASDTQLLWDSALLAASRAAAGEARFERLVPAAERILRDHVTYSVTFNDATPPSTGDPRDYSTTHARWWPDPDAPDGLPYVLRDVVNPDSRADVDQWSGLYADVLRLAVAWHATGEERYAAGAAELVRIFFLDPITGMHPHMAYSKRIPGVDERGSFEVATLSNRVRWLWDSVRLLRGSAAWTDADDAGFTAWTRDFLDWMESDPAPRREYAGRNNHSTAYHLIAAVLAKHLGDEAKARAYGRHYAEVLLPLQFDPEGWQPYEMTRSDNRFYHVYNLKTALDIQAVVDDLGVDFLAELERPLERLLPFLDGSEAWTAWPGRPREPNLKWEYDLLTQAAVQFGRPELHDLARTLRPPIPWQEYVWPRPDAASNP